MQTITIAVIAAAAAAGIIGAVLYFVPLFATAEPDNRQPITNNTAPVNNSGYRQVNVTLNNVTLVADIAETGEQRSKGLTIKDSLAEDEAMLFVFKKPGTPAFWMPSEMKFPIDIIWISEYHEVVHIEHSLEPCPPNSFCPSYEPDRKSLYVLETVAGFAQKYNITEDTHVDFVLEEEE